MSEQVRVVSYGGGVQSTALLVLAARGTIDYRTFIFANVGNDAEHPATLRYVREHALPYATTHGIDLLEVHKRRRDGSPVTLFQYVTREPSRSITLPVRVNDGGFMRRNCTSDWKIKVISRTVKDLGATPERPALVALGISTDELHRARTHSGEPLQQLDYPLLRLRLDRADCVQIIRSVDLPVPPKSSCWFCPFHSNETWQRMREDEPELFRKAVALEEQLNRRSQLLHGVNVYFHNRKRPLLEATSAYRQGRLFEDHEDTCESGYCMV